MRAILKYGLMLLMSWLPMIGAAQLKDSSRTAIHVGILRNTVDPFTEGTASVERSIWKRSSVLATLGINPITRKGVIHPIWQLYWHASVEVRYYYALRRRYLMSGFYVGVYACYNHKAYYYDHTWNTYMRETTLSAGPLIGYQHALGHRVRASWGFTTVFYPNQHESFYNDQGQLVGRWVWPANYTFYTYLRIGITL